MSEVGEKLKQHYASQFVAIDVDDWEELFGTDTIYAKPYTLSEDSEYRGFLDKNDPEGWAEILIRRAVFKDGTKVFDRGDKHAMMNIIPAHIVKNIAMQMLASVSLEDAVGNSETKVTSLTGS